MKIQNNKQQVCIRNGRIWEKSVLHLKSAIPGFDHKNIVDQIELDLWKMMVR